MSNIKSFDMYILLIEWYDCKESIWKMTEIANTLFNSFDKDNAELIIYYEHEGLIYEAKFDYGRILNLSLTNCYLSVDDGKNKILEHDNISIISMLSRNRFKGRPYNISNRFDTSVRRCEPKEWMDIKEYRRVKPIKNIQSIVR